MFSDDLFTVFDESGAGAADPKHPERNKPTSSDKRALEQKADDTADNEKRYFIKIQYLFRLLQSWYFCGLAPISMNISESAYACELLAVLRLSDYSFSRLFVPGNE